MMKVSVIIPVYGVERFVERCIRSLLEQTLQEIELIVVDDCSPDNSVAIIQRVVGEYPHRLVKFITHETNKGLPAARNTGLAIARGEYIFHCDSDDFVEPDMLETLYDAAKEKDADIVWCDWFLSFEKNERYMKQPQYASSMEALKGMLSGVMKYNVWNKLIRRRLYTDYAISFPAGYGMGEDMTVIKLFAYAQTVAYIPKAFYHYVKLNTTAFSNTYSEKHLVELKHNVQDVLCFLTDRYGEALKTEMAFFKLDVKFPFLISDDKKRYDLWTTWYPEANSYIMQHKNVGVRRWLLQVWAAKGQFGLIRFYYRFVHKFVYGIIFR